MGCTYQNDVQEKSGGSCCRNGSINAGLVLDRPPCTKQGALTNENKSGGSCCRDGSINAGLVLDRPPCTKAVLAEIIKCLCASLAQLLSCTVYAVTISLLPKRTIPHHRLVPHSVVVPRTTCAGARLQICAKSTVERSPRGHGLQNERNKTYLLCRVIVLRRRSRKDLRSVSSHWSGRDKTRMLSGIVYCKTT